MSGKEGLRIAVGIAGPDTVPGQTEAAFESADPSGRLVIPVERLLKTLHDSSSDWRKQDLVIQASGVVVNDDEPDTLFSADNRIELSRHQRTIAVDENPVYDLTMYEFNFLDFLMSNLDKVHQRPDIYQAVWQHSMRRGDRTVDVYVNKLRNKLGRVSEDLADRKQGAIRSRIGVGYYAVSSLRSV